jgi:hypothetical protein
MSRLVSMTPALCAVHCVVAPLLAGTLPLIATPMAEWLLLAVSAAIAFWLLVSGFTTHRQLGPCWLGGLGLACWLGAMAELLPASGQDAVAMTGGLIMAGALQWSGRLRHAANCAACGCPAHDTQSSGGM